MELLNERPVLSNVIKIADLFITPIEFSRTSVQVEKEYQLSLDSYR